MFIKFLKHIQDQSSFIKFLINQNKVIFQNLIKKNKPN